MAYFTLGAHNHEGDYPTTQNENHIHSNGSLYAAGIHNPALQTYANGLNF